MNPIIKDRIIRCLNAAENDSGSQNTEYDKIYLYRDGPGKTKQVTLGRGYTESGSLWKVFEYYKELGGKNADTFLARKKDSGKEKLPYDKDFLHLIIDSAKQEKAMRDAEDKTFDDLYWIPAENWFSQYGFKENLSLAIIEDSKLHSGGMLKFLTNSFPEKKPSDGGNERAWITAYIYARYNWLAHASELLTHTVYRPLFFINQIKKGNWMFDLPLIMNGTNITDATELPS